jgi:hypothetical protein
MAFAQYRRFTWNDTGLLGSALLRFVIDGSMAYTGVERG